MQNIILDDFTYDMEPLPEHVEKTPYYVDETTLRESKEASRRIISKYINIVNVSEGVEQQV